MIYFFVAIVLIFHTQYITGLLLSVKLFNKVLSK